MSRNAALPPQLQPMLTPAGVIVTFSGGGVTVLKSGGVCSPPITPTSVAMASVQAGLSLTVCPSVKRRSSAPLLAATVPVGNAGAVNTGNAINCEPSPLCASVTASVLDNAHARTALSHDCIT